jgi:hypothetical protein
MNNKKAKESNENKSRTKDEWKRGTMNKIIEQQ